jgi:hypothetical protein
MEKDVKIAELVIPEPRVERDRPAQELVTARLAQIPANQPPTLLAYLRAAESGADLDRLEKLIYIHREWENNEARKAFADAIAQFKRNPPEIYKNKHVKFKSERTGNITEYDHATHSEVTMKIVARLAAYGFSHRWLTTQPNGQVCVQCILTHRLGWSESQELTAPPDTSGLKSPVQAIASTRTLLERYTLLGATGLSAADLPDADDKADIPQVPQDVWIALGDASKEGESALRRMWEALNETTRDTIFESYAQDWSELKNAAKAADFRKAGMDAAHNMRRLINLDMEEHEVARQIQEENARLNKIPDLLNAAWDVLSSEERRAWRGWNDWRAKK